MGRESLQTVLLSNKARGVVGFVLISSHDNICYHKGMFGSSVARIDGSISATTRKGDDGSIPIYTNIPYAGIYLYRYVLLPASMFATPYPQQQHWKENNKVHKSRAAN